MNTIHLSSLASNKSGNLHLLAMKRELIRSGKHGQNFGEKLVEMKQSYVVVGGKEVGLVVEGPWERSFGCSGGRASQTGYFRHTDKGLTHTLAPPPVPALLLEMSFQGKVLSLPWHNPFNVKKKGQNGLEMPFQLILKALSSGVELVLFSL